MKENIIGILVGTLLIVTIIVPVAGTVKVNTVSTSVASRGFIQGLIDNASDGDTIYIPSGIYYENIIINKSISLVGEGKNTTIIDGNENGTVVFISADRVNISGFTIQYGKYGIALYISCGSTVKNNSIIFNNENGIRLHGASGNIIRDDIISNNKIGIKLEEGCVGAPGIFVNCHKNTIIKNNFLDNKLAAYFIYGFQDPPLNNPWIQNYWNRPRQTPKLVIGKIRINTYLFDSLPWFNIDLRPAFKPYDIPGVIT